MTQACSNCSMIYPSPSRLKIINRVEMTPTKYLMRLDSTNFPLQLFFMEKSVSFSIGIAEMKL